MTSKTEILRKYLLERPDVSDIAAARELGVNRSTVWRARAFVATPDVVPVATLADGFYQVQDGKPYRIACSPGDVFHVDADGVLQPGQARRTVLVRRTS